MHRFLNAIYYWAVQRVKPDELEEWKMMLEAPMPGRKAQAQRPAPWSDEDEAADFMNAMSTVGK
jgi:hypothetical protein